jgi:carboxypeptidase T
MADTMEVLINNVHDSGYTSPEHYGGITTGDTTDWTYGIFGMPSFTFELPPKTGAGGGFILPESQIIPTCQENLPAALYLIEWSR